MSLITKFKEANLRRLERKLDKIREKNGGGIGLYHKLNNTKVDESDNTKDIEKEDSGLEEMAKADQVPSFTKEDVDIRLYNFTTSLYNILITRFKTNSMYNSDCIEALVDCGSVSLLNSMLLIDRLHDFGFVDIEFINKTTKMLISERRSYDKQYGVIKVPVSCKEDMAMILDNVINLRKYLCSKESSCKNEDKIKLLLAEKNMHSTVYYFTYIDQHKHIIDPLILETIEQLSNNTIGETSYYNTRPELKLEDPIHAGYFIKYAESNGLGCEIHSDVFGKMSIMFKIIE